MDTPSLAGAVVRARPAWFIAGTDTGVGKTAVATALTLALARSGTPAVYIKPVQTGCQRGADGSWAAPDLLWAGARFNALTERRAEIEGVVLRGYATPCAPHLAARREGVPFDLPAVRRALRDVLRAAPAAVVEGAGGLLSPLDEHHDTRDLLRGLRVPVILVARAGLGTLSPTLATAEALRRARLNLAGIVLTQPEPGSWGFIERDNTATLAARLGAPVLAAWRHQAFLNDPPRSARWLARAGARLLAALVPG
jgi:dethiobiotin synthetase